MDASCRPGGGTEPWGGGGGTEEREHTAFEIIWDYNGLVQDD
jgi:hypothetical protein